MIFVLGDPGRRRRAGTLAYFFFFLTDMRPPEFAEEVVVAGLLVDGLLVEVVDGADFVVDGFVDFVVLRILVPPVAPVDCGVSSALIGKVLSLSIVTDFFHGR